MTLDELIELEKQATPGEWECEDDPYTEGRVKGDGYTIFRSSVVDPDGRFIAALRNIAPDLLALAKVDIEKDEALSQLEGLSNYVGSAKDLHAKAWSAQLEMCERKRKEILRRLRGMA